MSTKHHPLESEALVKRYGPITALNGISLQINAGVTAVLGQNGAGKTTLIRCALGLGPPSAGNITLFGIAPRQRASRQRVGVMLQDTELPDLLSGRELITLYASYYPAPMGINALIEMTGIGAFVDQRYKKLSGGQKRRIQFAIAVVGNPDLVFLDEPTTGLDSEARKSLWDTVRGFAADGRSIVLTTHYLEEAENLCRHIAIIDHGKLIEHTTMKGLLGTLDRETFIFDLSHPLYELPPLEGLSAQRIDDHTLEIEVARGTELNGLFARLTEAGIGVRSMRNKANRLEERFVRLLGQEAT